MLSLLLLLACAPAADDSAPPDPRAALARVVATLDEAARLDDTGQEAAARDAWRRAHALYEQQLAPALEARHGWRVAFEGDYRFALVRRALDEPSGRPEQEASKLALWLEDHMAETTVELTDASPVAP